MSQVVIAVSAVMSGEGSKSKVGVDAAGFFVDSATGAGVCVGRISVTEISGRAPITSATRVDVGWIPLVDVGFVPGKSNPPSAASRRIRIKRLKSQPDALSGRNPKKKRVSVPKSIAQARCAAKTKMPCGKISPTPLARPKAAALRGKKSS